MLGNRITVVPRHFVADGIDAVKEKFSRFHFSEAGCAEGLKMLRSYRREWDDDRGMFKDKPKHDKFSHGADALRYAVMGLRSHMPTKDIEIFPPDDPDKPDPNDKRTPVLVVGDSQTQRAISLTELFEHNEFGGRRRDRRI